MSCKEPGRDYATTAFINFAALGRPTREAYEEEIKKEIYQKLAFDEPGFIVVKANAAVLEKDGLLRDIEAVNRVLYILKSQKKQHVIDAIEEIYFPYAGIRHARGTITSRVRRFAHEYPASEATVYRWLKSARVLFCHERGMSISGILTKHTG